MSYKYTVKSTDFYVGTLCRFHSCEKVDIGYAENYIAVRVLNEGFEFVDESRCFGGSVVHFPVAGNDGFSCCFVHFYYLAFCFKIYM